MKKVFFIALFFVFAPLTTNAVGTAADAMCTPVIPTCPCGTVPSKKGCVPGANMFMCPCVDVTAGRTTMGKCVAMLTCKGESSEGLGGGADALKSIADIMKQIMDMMKGGGGEGGGGGGTGTGLGSGCAQYTPVSVPTSNPCEYYVPSVGTTTPATTTATITISANPTSVASGQSTSLQWSTTNAASCVATGGWTGTQSLQGYQLIENITSARTFMLTCTGTDGGSISNSVSITVFTPTTSSGPTSNPTNNPTATTPARGPVVATNPGLSNQGRISNGFTGDVVVRGSGGSVVVNSRNTNTNTEVAGFYGGTLKSGGSGTTFVGRICQNRPWSGFVSRIIPASFFDSACEWRGYSTQKPVTPAPVRTATPRKTASLKQATTTVATTTALRASTTASAVGFADVWAVPSSVPVGSRTSIFWNTKNVTSCTVTSPDGSFNEKALSGGASTVPLSDATTFSISCIGTDGGPVTDFVTVKMKL